MTQIKTQYATPTLTTFGSVRNLTGGSSLCRMDADGTVMVLSTVNTSGNPCV